MTTPLAIQELRAADPAPTAATKTSSFAPTIENTAKSPDPAPDGMVWIPGREHRQRWLTNDGQETDATLKRC